MEANHLFMFALPLLAATLAALGSPADWHSLQFRRIPPIETQLTEDRLTLKVRSSAGGLVRQLPRGTQVQSLIVTGSVEGELKVDADRLWQKGHEDAYLRVGLIVAGGRPLGTLERLMAPAWIVTMDKVLCADGRAPAAIRNHLLIPHAAWIGQQRPNPHMAQLVDHMVTTPDANGRFTMRVDLPETMELVGLWLMTDGDDSGSTFTVTVDSLELSAP